MSADVEETIAAIQASRLPDHEKGRLARLLQLRACTAQQMCGRELAAMRAWAGLAPGQAAKLLGIKADLLAAYERDDADLQRDPDLLERMNKVYDLGRGLA